MQPVAENNGYDFVTIDGNIDLPSLNPAGGRGALDYYLRDYQQNVRMILTEETHIGSNQATMETARAAGEEALFGQTGGGNEVAATRFPSQDIPGGLIGQPGWENPDIGSYVSRLGNLAAKKIGPNTLLKVMAGDEISSFADYYYNEVATNGTGNNLLSSVLSSLISVISGSPVAAPDVKDGATNINNNLGNSIPFGDAVAPDANNPNGDNPKAYLNILFFNERFEFIEEGSTAVRVQQAGNGAAPLLLTNIKSPKNGYCFVYLSNESDVHVYFNNFKVTHNRKHIIEENHYYSYGLKIAAISSRKVGDAREGHLDNKYGYQGTFSEMDDDIGWNDFDLRNYDPQVGRWVQQDPYQEYPSPYTGMGNDPVNNVDPNGGNIFSGVSSGGMMALKATVGFILGTVYDMATDGNGKGQIIGAVLGAASGGLNLLTATQAVLQTVNLTSTQINTAFAEKQVGNNLNGTNSPSQKQKIDVASPGPVKGKKRGTITVNEYTVQPNDRANLGVILELLYEDNSSGFSDFQWIQNVETNHPKQETPGTQHVDPWDGKNFPFYWEEREYEFENRRFGETDARFFDRPLRPFYNEKVATFFKAELTLVGKDSRGWYHPLITFTWGFEISTSGKVTKKPLTHSYNQSLYQNLLIDEANKPKAKRRRFNF